MKHRSPRETSLEKLVERTFNHVVPHFDASEVEALLARNYTLSWCVVARLLADGKTHQEKHEIEAKILQSKLAKASADLKEAQVNLQKVRDNGCDCVLD